MNHLTYHLAATRRDELLRQAADYRLATQGAATTTAAPVPARRRRRPSRRTIAGLPATRDRAAAHTIPSIEKLGGKA